MSRLTRDVIGTSMLSSRSLVARRLTGLGLKYMVCIVLFVSAIALHDAGGLGNGAVWVENVEGSWHSLRKGQGRNRPNVGLCRADEMPYTLRLLDVTESAETHVRVDKKGPQ